MTEPSPGFQMVGDGEISLIADYSRQLREAEQRAIELTLRVGELGEQIAELLAQQQPLAAELNELNAHRHALQIRRANLWWPDIDGPPPWSSEFWGRAPQEGDASSDGPGSS